MSFEMVLPTGEIIRVGDGGGKKIRKSSTGYHLKHLFMGHQGTLGIVTEATLELVPRPEAEFAAFFAFGGLPQCSSHSARDRHLWHRNPRRNRAVRRRRLSTCAAMTRRSSPCRRG